MRRIAGRIHVESTFGQDRPPVTAAGSLGPEQAGTRFHEFLFDRGLLIRHGTSYWTGLPALPPRGHEAVLEGNAVRHAQVRRRPSRRRAGHAPVPPRQGQRIRHPPAGEAEGQALLRDLRAAVPQVLRRGQPPAGQHRRCLDVAPGAAAGQRGHPAGVRHRAGRRPGR